jgi:hypothetical protein
MQNGSKLDERILIHTLKLKIWQLEILPYVCIGSRIYAMFFAHKKMGAQGTWTTLYRTLCIYCYLGCLLALCGSTLHPALLRGDNYFFCFVCGLLEKKNSVYIKVTGSLKIRNFVL